MNILKENMIGFCSIFREKISRIIVSRSLHDFRNLENKKQAFRGICWDMVLFPNPSRGRTCITGGL